ncbi:MAG: RNA 2'-phosphotransferase [Candidatus Omnitrophota bacterium]|nr:RNA 2'-phosphotransferase [Candidatus Omnitrophota bacterium]
MIPPYEFDAERFSRWMAYVLRHNPARYGLQPDRHGYVDFDAFLLIATRRCPALSLDRLRRFMTTDAAPRFELVGTRLRARYGHSIPVEPVGAPVTPPPQLYHGTEAARVEAIRAEGLSPMGRQLLHLSGTREEATAIARRRTDQPVVVRVFAQEAHAAGIAFYREGNIYLTFQVPAQFLSLVTPDPEGVVMPPAGAPAPPPA